MCTRLNLYGHVQRKPSLGENSLSVSMDFFSITFVEQDNNIYQCKMESHLGVALRTRTGRLKSLFVPWELALSAKIVQYGRVL